MLKQYSAPPLHYGQHRRNSRNLPLRLAERSGKIHEAYARKSASRPSWTNSDVIGCATNRVANNESGKSPITGDAVFLANDKENEKRGKITSAPPPQHGPVHGRNPCNCPCLGYLRTSGARVTRGGARTNQKLRSRRNRRRARQRTVPGCRRHRQSSRSAAGSPRRQKSPR